VPILRSLTLLALSATLSPLACRAQTPFVSPVVANQPLPADLSHRVEVLLRNKAELPPGSTVQISPAVSSDFPNFYTILVAVQNDGKVSHPIPFLISTDGKTLAQLTKYDISADPRLALSDKGRPARGGPETAPVIIVGFDDLECPYCARLHASIFPAITQRYGDKVRIVYKDFPLDMHPWALRAAVDVNCLAPMSGTAYWNAVDSVHAHASTIGDNPNPSKDAKEKDEKTLERANAQLDKIVMEQGAEQKVNMIALDACIKKQDATEVEASKKEATDLNLASTPTLFINGDKIDGAVPIEFIFGVIAAGGECGAAAALCGAEAGGCAGYSTKFAGEACSASEVIRSVVLRQWQGIG
jgi:protein-disulfide isomerase